MLTDTMPIPPQARSSGSETAETVARQERQRILADLHDGLGASLIGLLHHVRSGQADLSSIEQRVREALLEMRVAIDALRPNEGRLDTVLGNLRYRLADMIRGAGMRLVWDMETLPPNHELAPPVVSSIQRIVLEAVTNALKHSSATQLRLSARVLHEEGIQICISDDGRGFDPAHHSSGVGLSSIFARARRIGAQLDIISVPGAGTKVRLVLAGPPRHISSSRVHGRPLR